MSYVKDTSIGVFVAGILNYFREENNEKKT